LIVVDTNLIAYLWIAGEFTEKAEKLLQTDPHWLAPLLWRSEFRNVLAGFYRRGKLSLTDTLEIIENAEAQMRERELLVSSHSVMQLVSKSSCAAYDCEFAALALELELPLVTTDQQILNDFPEIAQSPDQFIKQS
jgi:predicted nucleic acid-binding protein